MPFGNPFEFLPLTIMAPESAERPLTVSGPHPVSGAPTLFAAAPEAIFVPLWIGPARESTDTAPLFLQSPWAVGESWPTATGVTAIAPLAVSGSLWYTGDGSMPLFMHTGLIGSGDANTTLHVSGELGTTTTTAQLAVTAIPEIHMPLFLPIEEVGTSGISLYINKGFGAIAPLTITSQIVSGVVPVAISGAYHYNSSTTLFIKPPTNKSFTTFTRGFDDC